MEEPGCRVPHPIGEWLEEKFPWCVVEAFWTPYGIYFTEMEIFEQGKNLLGRIDQIFKAAFEYADHSGETLFACPGSPEDSMEYRRRLVKVYERCGAKFDPRRGFIYYPPERAYNGYQVLNRGPEKYEGIL